MTSLSMTALCVGLTIFPGGADSVSDGTYQTEVIDTISNNDLDAYVQKLNDTYGNLTIRQIKEITFDKDIIFVINGERYTGRKISIGRTQEREIDIKIGDQKLKEPFTNQCRIVYSVQLLYTDSDGPNYGIGLSLLPPIGK